MSLPERDRWPHVLRLPDYRRYITDALEAKDPRVIWCRENLKSNQWRYDGWHPINFRFKNRADAVMFSLRWICINPLY